MSLTRTASVRIRSRYEDIPLVRRVMSSVREETALSHETMVKVEICLIEVIGNSIRHAYGMRDDGEIDVAFRLEGDRFVIEVSDRGRTMSPDKQHLLVHGEDLPRPDRAHVDRIPEGGMGFPILRRVLDGVEYESRDGRNTLRMTKRYAASSATAR
ncbi:ATP-binding protein [bacterium]|nr:ATP-binding protein [bacterium]